MDREQLEFVRQRGLAVVAARDANGEPQAALVGVAAIAQGEIVFDTLTSSRKYSKDQLPPTGCAALAEAVEVSSTARAAASVGPCQPTIQTWRWAVRGCHLWVVCHRWLKRVDDERGGRRYGRGPRCLGRCVLCVFDLVGTQHEHIEEVRWLNSYDNKIGNSPAASMVRFIEKPNTVQVQGPPAVNVGVNKTEAGRSTSRRSPTRHGRTTCRQRRVTSNTHGRTRLLPVFPIELNHPRVAKRLWVCPSIGTRRRALCLVWLNACSATLLNMRSAVRDLDDSRSRMVHAAVERIGRVGRQAATVRKVAEAAGVSAPLVMHHFGSKAGLVRACDEHVRSRLEAAMAIVGGSGHDAGLRDLLGVDGIETAIVYVGRSMQDGGEVGREWFDHMFEMSVTQYEGLLAAGTARPSQDPTMLALLLMAMDLGMVLLRPLVEQTLGSNLTDPAVVQRWMRTEFDLLTHGLMIHKEKT